MYNGNSIGKGGCDLLKDQINNILNRLSKIEDRLDKLPKHISMPILFKGAEWTKGVIIHSKSKIDPTKLNFQLSVMGKNYQASIEIYQLINPEGTQLQVAVRLPKINTDIDNALIVVHLLITRFYMDSDVSTIID